MKDSICHCPSCEKELSRHALHIERSKRAYRLWLRLAKRNQFKRGSKGAEPVIRHNGEWEGIQGEWVDDSTAIDGQRFICAPGAVHEMRLKMRSFAKNRCEICTDWAYHGERHHIFGRGIGGGKREDRPLVLGVRFVLWTCRECHEVQIIKPWGSWSHQQLRPSVECQVEV